MTGAPAGVVLAAGLGTRLRPLTDHRPKALCPVGNVPLVDSALARVRTVAQDVAVNVHAGRARMEEHLAGAGVHLSVEADVPLGTAGALGKLRDWVAGRPVLVGNTDAWHRFDVRTLLDGWDGDFGPWRYVGSTLLPWPVVAGLEPEPSGLHDRVWMPALAAGRLELVEAEGEFFDCGTPADYLAANLCASGGESVVGAGAVVEGELVRSVVWPGGVVRRDERLVESIRVGADLTVDARLGRR